MSIEKRHHIEQAFAIALREIPTLRADSGTLEEWMEVLGVWSSRHGTGAPEKRRRIDTGVHLPEDITRDVIRRLCRENWLEPAPGDPGKWRVLQQRGRNIKTAPKEVRR